MTRYGEVLNGMRASGFGILAGLGQAISGIEAPDVSNPLEHGLVGLAVALIMYAQSELTHESQGG